MSRSLDKVLPLLIGLCAFLLVTGGLMLWPSNVAWFGGGDPLQHYLGWAFFRADEWRFPLGLNPHFGLELGSAIAFSDSLPLLALPFKALSPWLTPTFQYFGLWVLVCFVLQAFFAWKIAGLATEDRGARAAMAAILAVAPPMIWRLHGHISLFSHFVIIAALYLYAVSRTKRRPVAFALMVAVSTLVHAYLAVMVAAIWLASLCDGWLRQGARLRACFGELALGLTLSAFAAWQAGYFSVGKGTASGGYGIYRMNLLSLFDADGWSHVLPDIPGGWGDYEGFNYLGLGLLTLLVVNLPFAVSDLRTLSARIGRSPVLALVALGLTVFGMTNVVGFGAFSFELPLPTPLEGIANTFRSSGRMFWPVFYLIAFWLLFATLRNWGERRGRWLLLLALGLQVWDTSAGWAFRPRLLSPPSAELTLPMKDPFWGEAAKRYARVRWVLPMNKSPHWETVATYALRHGMATDATYLARIGSDALASAVATAHRALETGVYEPDSLYLLDDASARTAFETLRPGDMLAKIDDFIVLAPGWMTCETCDKSYRLDASALFGPLKVDEPIRLGKDDGAKIYLGSGWGEQEEWGVWTGDDTARIGFADPLPAHFRLTLQARAFGPNIGADVEVVAGNFSATFRLTSDLSEVSVELDPGVAINGLSLRVPHAVSPAELGINGDIRRLGIGVAWFEITPLQP